MRQRSPSTVMFDTLSDAATLAAAMPSLSRRTDAQSARRAAIEASVLEATERLLTEGAAYADLSVERIATEAGISRTAFYFYFRDKRELLMRLTGDIAAELYEQSESWWESGEPPQAAMRHSIERTVAQFREHAVLIRAVVQSATYDEPVAEFWRGLVHRFVETMRTHIEDEQAAGRAIADVDAERTAFSLSWMVERACQQHVFRAPADDDEALVDALVQISLRAIYGRLDS